MQFLSGKKSYIVMIATYCFAIGGMVLGKISYNEGIMLILGASGLGSLRNGINKSEAGEK